MLIFFFPRHKHLVVNFKIATYILLFLVGKKNKLVLILLLGV